MGRCKVSTSQVIESASHRIVSDRKLKKRLLKNLSTELENRKRSFHDVISINLLPRFTTSTCPCSLMTSCLVFQSNVPDVSSAVVRTGPTCRLHPHDGLRSGRRQTIPLLLPQLQLGRRRLDFPVTIADQKRKAYIF